jgi:hypothetical protein
VQSISRPQSRSQFQAFALENIQENPAGKPIFLDNGQSPYPNWPVP